MDNSLLLVELAIVLILFHFQFTTTLIRYFWRVKKTFDQLKDHHVVTLKKK